MAIGANTADALHTIGIIAACERPCARKPTIPNIPANTAPSTRCHVTSTRGGSGMAGAVRPEGATRFKKLNLSAQSAKTIKVNKAAAGTAPTAASARQDIASVTAVSSVKVSSASGSCALASTTVVEANK